MERNRRMVGCEEGKSIEIKLHLFGKSTSGPQREQTFSAWAAITTVDVEEVHRGDRSRFSSIRHSSWGSGSRGSLLRMRRWWRPRPDRNPSWTRDIFSNWWSRWTWWDKAPDSRPAEPLWETEKSVGWEISNHQRDESRLRTWIKTRNPQSPTSKKCKTPLKRHGNT